MADQQKNTDEGARVDEEVSQSGGRELESALKELERWAAAENAEDDKAVQRLVRALRSRQNLVMWANKDIDTFLPAPKPRELGSLTVVAQAMLVARNVLIFVPILLTWRAIGAASIAFSSFSEIVPVGTDINFLRYWQTGGEGLILNATIPPEALVPPGERLSAVAANVAWIIGGVIALTLVASIIRSINVWREGTQMRVAEQDRTDVVLTLESALHGYRQATPTSISESLAESLSELLRAAHQLGATAQQLERSTVGVADLGPAIAGFTEQLARAEERFDKGITPNLARLGSTVEAISGKLNTDFEKTLQQSLVGLGQLSDRMQETVFTLEVATQEVRTNIEQILARLRGYAG